MKGMAKIMNTTTQSNIITYLVICVSEFAERFKLDCKSAYRYLAAYGGIAFLIEYYEIEHTLSLNDAVDDLDNVCRQNGGILQ
jgi:hypothetical protein